MVLPPRLLLCFPGLRRSGGFALPQPLLEVRVLCAPLRKSRRQICGLALRLLQSPPQCRLAARARRFFFPECFLETSVLGFGFT